MLEEKTETSIRIVHGLKASHVAPLVQLAVVGVQLAFHFPLEKQKMQITNLVLIQNNISNSPCETEKIEQGCYNE